MGDTGAIDLDPAHRATILILLKQHVPECEVRAYGSRVNFTAEQYSDLDLAILGADESSLWQISHLRQAFEESDLPFRVDVMNWNRIPDSFREEIAESYAVLQSGNAQTRWKETTLGAFAPLVYGKSLPASKRVADGSILVYGSNGIIGTHDTPLTDSPTIVVGRKGSVGTVHYSPSPCWPIDTAFYTQESDTELARFKYYALSLLGLEGMNTDSAVPGLNRDAAHARRVRIPDEVSQRAISRVAGALDDRIELNRQMCETLEEVAQALFRAWFVDFEPVRAKMEGRWREGESLPGLPAEMYHLFPSELIDSEFGRVPTGWRVIGLDGVAEFINGLALQQYPPVGTDSLPVIKIAQLRSEDIGGAARARADLDGDFVISDGEILFSWSGSLECELWTGGRGAVNQHLFKVVPRKVPKWLCFLAIRHHLPWFRHIAAGKATTMGHIQRHHLVEAKLACPPRELLQASDKVFGPLIGSIVAHKLDTRQIGCQRTVLLPELIAGRLRVPVSPSGRD